MNNLGLLAWHRGEFDSAVGRFEDALAARESMKNDHEVAATCNNLSLVWWEKGDLKRAMEYQERSLGIKERIGDRYGTGVSYLNMGLIFVDLGEWDKALESYFRALAEKERADDRTEVALCYSNIGEVYLKRGKLERSRSYFEQALAIQEAAPSLWVQAEALGNMGEAAFRAGDYARARDCYERDRQICIQSGDREELAETLRRSAELHLAQAEPDRCRAELEQALALCAKSGSRKEEGNVRRVMAQLELARGNPDAALAAVREGAGILRQVGRKFELGEALVSQGRIELALGRDASDALGEALAIFEELGVPGRAHEASELISRAPGAMGPESLLDRLTELACLDCTLDDFGRQAVGLIAGCLAEETVRLVLPDGRKFGHGSEPAAGSVEHCLRVGPRSVGNLVLGSGADRQNLGPAARVLALALDRLSSRTSQTGPKARAGYPDIIGAGSSLRPVMETVERVAATKASVLILGESGTGKELVARTLHRLSDRRTGPFVPVNCAAIPETLLESELFGIEKGTATGVAERKGKFEAASHGTVFLDEIGDMSLTLQAKMLRVLEDHVVERVGGRRQIPVDVRIVAATNQDLEQAMALGRFRQDLFFRLNVVTLFLPPLRERRQDISEMADWFLVRFSREYGKSVGALSEDTRNTLLNYSWPGNVRELENVIERAVILARADLVVPEDLPAGIMAGGPAEPGWHDLKTKARMLATGAAERSALAAAMAKAGWSVKAAAEHLGISERQLYRLVKKYGLKRPS